MRQHQLTEESVQAAGDGPLPLQVMLETMRRHYDRGNLDSAAVFARYAAPYLHPKLAALTIEADVDHTVRVIEDESWYQNTAHDHVRNGAPQAAHHHSA